MAISGEGWEIQVKRLREQKRGTARRTVGAYQVFHNGQPARPLTVSGVEVPLSGTSAESPGPSQNVHPATARNPSRILPGRYPLKTSGGPTYVTHGYRSDLRITARMPGVELRKICNRSDILILPGQDEFH
jgi:hypothetical protein